jgi:hypothetical protein
LKVIGGSHHLGETGMVVRVGSSLDTPGASSANATVLHVLTDLSQQEITVRSAHVQECAEVRTQRDAVFQLELWFERGARRRARDHNEHHWGRALALSGKLI